MTQKTELMELPLAKCVRHPMTEIRLDYTGPDIAELAESIRQNGQFQPGEAVFDAKSKKYLIFSGQRRLAALQLLKQKYGKPNTYKAIVYDKLTDEEVTIHALVENGKRTDLKPEEEIRYFHTIYERYDRAVRAKIATALGTTEQKIERESKLYETLGSQFLAQLYELEKKAAKDKDFHGLTLSHIEEIAKEGTNLGRLNLAAHILKTNIPSTQIKMIVESRDVGAASFIPVYSDELKGIVTPEEEEELKARGNAFDQETVSDQIRSDKPSAPVSKVENEFLTTDGRRVECPFCGASNFFELDDAPTMKFRNPVKDPDRTVVEKVDLVPSILVVGGTNCWQCGKKFVVKVASVESGLTVEVTKTGDISGFKEKAERVALAYNQKVGYMLTAGDKKYIVDAKGKLKAVGP